MTQLTVAAAVDALDEEGEDVAVADTVEALAEIVGGRLMRYFEDSWEKLIPESLLGADLRGMRV